MKYIGSFHDGDRIVDTYLCKSRQQAVAKNGKAYAMMKDYYSHLPAYNCGVDVCDFEPKTLDELIKLKEANKNEPYIN